jgi:hypothetical protein
MLKALVCSLLLGSVAFAQAALPHPSVPMASPTPAPAAAELPPTAPVITIAGFCPNAPAAEKNSPACKTVITKAEFEKLIETLNPKMPPQARQSVAGDYAKMLVFADDAKKRGLEDTPRFKTLVKFVTMQLAAQELVRSMQEQTKPSAAEVEKYYQDNKSKYEEISLKRIFIPRNNPNAKPTDPKPTDDELKKEGEKALEEIASGADFDKVEKEIYDSKGYKTPPPPTTIPNWRKEAVPPAQASLFDLKQGELSQVMVEPAGAYIYKVVEKTTIPLDTVKPEIESRLGSEQMRTKMEQLTSSLKPELNEAYFRGMAPGPGMIGPAAMHGGPVSPQNHVMQPAAQEAPMPSSTPKK